MAPKRAAKKAAPAPPPPPPPAESSYETRSGSRSRSDESEDEEAIAESPVPAATPAPKSTSAPAQQGDESESSDEEEEDEEPARAAAAAAAATAPKNQAPPPQKKEDSDDEEDDEEEEEEEEEEPTRAAPPSAPKKRPPEPPRRGEDSDASDDSESDEEAPPPPKEAAAVNPPAPAAAAAADEAKKPAAFHRIWSTDDEVRILEALAAHQKQHGAFPQPEALIDVLAGKLDNPAYGSKELQSKVKSLKHRYVTLSKRGEVPGKEHDRRVLDLSKIVWDGDKTTTAANNGEQKGFNEMCELYPYLAEEVKALEAWRPGMCKREFGKMDDDKARAMDEKIKKQRVLQIRVEIRRADLTKEVTKALVDLVDG